MSENANEAPPPLEEEGQGGKGEQANEETQVTETADSTKVVAATSNPLASAVASEVGTPVKSQEPSSGTDDDEPSAQPAVLPAQEGEEKTDEAAHAQGETKQLTAEEARAAFVNEGLIRWEAARNAWLGDRTGSDDSGSTPRRMAIPLDVDKIIDVLFYASSREVRAGSGKPEQFPRNVPLPQMVDILQGTVGVG